MDSEPHIVQNLFGALGMNNVRSIEDLYNIRQDTLVKRLVAAKGIRATSRVSIYAAWLQHELLSKSSHTDQNAAVEMFCTVSLNWNGSEDMLRKVWRDCAARATQASHTFERKEVRDICDFVDDGIKRYFKAKEKKRGTSFLRPSVPAAGCDNQRRQRSSWVPGIRPDPWGDSGSTAAPVDGWGTRPPEWYQCPNCSEYGIHWAQHCPRLAHVTASPQLKPHGYHDGKNPSGSWLRRESAVKSPHDTRAPQLGRRFPQENHRSKRPKRCQDHEAVTLYYTDTARCRLPRQQTPPETRIQRWRTGIRTLTPDNGRDDSTTMDQEMEARTHAETFATETQDAVRSSRPPSSGEHRSALLQPLAYSARVKVEEAEDYDMESLNEAMMTGGPPATPLAQDPSSSVSDSTSPKTTPSQVHFQKRASSSPLRTVDITSRPDGASRGLWNTVSSRVASRAVVKSEFDDITDMMNALEQAEDFLARLSASLEAGSRCVADTVCASEPMLPTEHVSPSGSQVRGTTAKSCSVSRYSGDDDSDLRGKRGGRGSGTTQDGMLLENPADGAHDADAEYSISVLELFKGHAPPLIQQSSRSAAVDMWLVPKRADSLENMKVEHEAEAVRDDLIIKIEEAEADGRLEGSDFGQLDFTNPLARTCLALAPAVYH